MLTRTEICGVFVEQLYHLCYWSPSPELSGMGFNVKLYPAWKEMVEIAKLDDEAVQKSKNVLSEGWLKSFGYDLSIHDPRTAIRISTGEWGPQHITVPGNACGLDLDSGVFAPKGGRLLTPHNVDSIRQAGLLLAIFSFYADTLVLRQEVDELEDVEKMRRAITNPTGPGNSNSMPW